LVGGVALPQGMDPVGTAVGRGPTTLRSGSEAGVGEPTADGTRTGEVETGVVMVQDDADQLSTPAGVLLPQGTSLLDELGRRRVIQRATAVGWGQGLAGLARLAQEASGSAQRQLKAAGEGGQIGALEAGAEEGLSNRQRSSGRHGKTLVVRAERRSGSRVAAPEQRGQTCCPISWPKSLSGDTATPDTGWSHR